jgi:hypothetical protein
MFLPGEAGEVDLEASYYYFFLCFYYYHYYYHYYLQQEGLALTCKQARSS